MRIPQPWSHAIHPALPGSTMQVGLFYSSAKMENRRNKPTQLAATLMFGQTALYGIHLPDIAKHGPSVQLRDSRTK